MQAGQQNLPVFPTPPRPEAKGKAQVQLPILPPNVTTSSTSTGRQTVTATTTAGRRSAFTEGATTQEINIEKASADKNLIREMNLWTNDKFASEIKKFSQEIGDEFATIVVERVPNGIDPKRRLQWLLERHAYQTKFFIKVHLSRGSSWYQYCSNLQSNATVRNRDLYVACAKALSIGQSKEGKVSGQVSPLTLASVLAPIMSMIRENLTEYCKFPNIKPTDQMPIPIRFQFAGSLSAWIFPNTKTEMEHALTSGWAVIWYGYFLQSYITSANIAKATEATSVQVLNFWEKLIRGCHLSLFLWSVETKNSFLNNAPIVPEAGPRPTAMSAILVKTAAQLCVAGDYAAAAGQISTHMVANLNLRPVAQEEGVSQ